MKEYKKPTIQDLAQVARGCSTGKCCNGHN